MFWKKKKPESSTSSPAADEKQPKHSHTRRHSISYNTGLIAALKEEHRILLDIYGKIMHSLDTREYLFIAELLAEFRVILKTHLLKEHIELYIYLEYVLAQDRQAFDYMHSLRMEMDQISAQVMGFLHNYQAMPVMAENAEQFREQFKKIAVILQRRIRQEEDTLYTLYAEID